MSGSSAKQRKGRKQQQQQQQQQKGGTDESPPSADHGPSRMRKLVVRVVFGFLMINAFIGILFTDHWIVAGLVLVLQLLSFRELLGVRYKEVKEREIPYFRLLNWYAFCIAVWTAYGPSFLGALELVSLLKYHRIISFAAFTGYFLGFVLSLKKGLYKYQITQMAWVWMVLLLVVGQAVGILWNLFQGIFWFLLPSALVVCNDIWAYFSGLAFGKKFVQRQFLALSPNKTWEGFIGAFIATLLFMPLQVYLYSIPDFWACPAGAELPCVRNEAFIPQTFALPQIFALVGRTHVTLAPIYVHGLVLATFASLIAPFGGFFASAIKRAFRMKDFDSIIPGHGGVVDRMDCQMIMQLFTWVYLRTFVFPKTIDVAQVLRLIATLSVADQRLVYEALRRMNL